MLCFLARLSRTLSVVRPVTLRQGRTSLSHLYVIQRPQTVSFGISHAPVTLSNLRPAKGSCKKVKLRGRIEMVLVSNRKSVGEVLAGAILVVEVVTANAPGQGQEYHEDLKGDRPHCI